MDKVYFSNCFDPKQWSSEDCGILTVFLVPKHWWSIREWNLAWSLRARFLEQMMRMMNENPGQK